MYRYMIIVLIILTIGYGFSEVMERWDTHMELKQEQSITQMRPTIGLPQGVAVEIGGIDVSIAEGTITLDLHIVIGDKYYYFELTLPSKEVQADEAN